ncbi:UAA transporter [Cristinia sonorae]|uniref:UAA transporter n=1 Tax=Cristinia sonorae TaxID=1940300 RepID=A0A8K0UK16_9AGAR|nr:UAA transporter [Cristinia sonorae]
MAARRSRSRTPLERRADNANAVITNLAFKKPPGRQGPTQRKRVQTEREPETGIPLTKPVVLSLVDLSFMLTLVFGGCCTNVWTYEYLLKIDSRLGTALTFSQMAFVTIHSLPSFLSWDRAHTIPLPSFKPRHVPVFQWALQVFVLTAGNLLTNWAYAFNVPLTIQIVFRSAGLVVSLIFGRLFLNKRYTLSQIASVLLVTIGVVLATLSRPAPPISQTTPDDATDYTIGISMLTLSLLLTGVLGMLQEITYKKYGPHWKEGLFYTHSLSLPVFLFLVPHVKYGFTSLSSSTSKFSSRTPDADPTFAALSANLPSAVAPLTPYLILAANLVTQLICVSGVNQLSSRVSSVSTNLVLTTRKALSLCFSVWWFGNGWNTELGIGAGMVFLGSLLYTLVSSSSSKEENDKKKDE